MKQSNNGCYNVKKVLYEQLKRIMYSLTKSDKEEKVNKLKTMKEYKRGRFSEYFKNFTKYLVSAFSILFRQSYFISSELFYFITVLHFKFNLLCRIYS